MASLHNGTRNFALSKPPLSFWQWLRHPLRSIARWTIIEQKFLQEQDRLRRARLTLIFLTVLLVWVAVFALYYGLLLRNQTALIIDLAAGACALIVPLILRWTASPFVAGNVLTGILFSAIASLQYVNSVPGRPLPAWMSAVPIISMTLAGRRSGYFWMACSLCGILASYWHDLVKFPMPDNPTALAMKRYQLMLLCSLTILITSLAMLYETVTARAFASLKAAQENLGQANKMAALGEMASGIAHEINNPLAIVQTSAAQVQELLQDKELQKQLIDERLTTIQQTISRIAGVISALKNFSRDGRQDEMRSELVLGIMKQVMSLCVEKLRAEHIDFTMDCQPTDLRVRCRAVEISQILLNLVSNSLDAISDQKDKWIKIECRETGDFVEIRIRDSGTSIAKGIQKKIFQPFFTTKEVGKGTGLGLSICQNLARANAGDLQFDSSAAETTFVLRLKKG